MSRPLSFFDTDDRLRSLSEAGDPLERLSTVIDFELFRPELEAVLARRDRGTGGRPPYDAVLMFKVLVVQTLYTLSDDQTEPDQGSALLHAVCRSGALRSCTRRQDNLALPRDPGLSRGV